MLGGSLTIFIHVFFKLGQHDFGIAKYVVERGHLLMRKVSLNHILVHVIHVVLLCHQNACHILYIDLDGAPDGDDVKAK